MPEQDPSIVWVKDVDLALALHKLRGGRGPNLLLLHELGASSPSQVPSYAESWPGPVWALDFAGHGASPIAVGGGYSAEALVSEADAALAHLEKATVIGHGLGAYVALLLAGARPDEVDGVVLADGAGLAGGGPLPQPPYVASDPPAAEQRPDPLSVIELSRDARPPDYAESFASVAITGSAKRPAIVVCAQDRPPWLAAVAGMDGVVELAVDDAIRMLTG